MFYGGVLILCYFTPIEATPLQFDFLLLDESPFQLLDETNFLLLGE